MNNDLGTEATGNRPWIKAVITAPNVTGHTTDTSTAITFKMHLPDDTETAAVSSPNADIVGPVAGVEAGTGLTTTTWYWKVPTLAQIGRHTVRWTSTAGVIAQDNSRFVVVDYAPFTTP